MGRRRRFGRAPVHSRVEVGPRYGRRPHGGSGSFVAAMGQMAVPLITDALGWSALWYFMLCSTVISCLLMIPKIKQELAGEEAPAPAAPKGGYATINTAEQKA